MSEEDGQNVRLCLDGRPDTYRELVARHQGRLVSYLNARLGDEERAAEAAQEAFVRAYFALRKLRAPGSFFAWLVGIARRVAKEAAREEARRRQVGWRETGGREEEGTDAAGAVREAVQALPEVYREVVQLRFYGGLSCAEVGSQLGVPVGTVTKRLSRAYGMLRRSLEKAREGEDSEVRP